MKVGQKLEPLHRLAEFAGAVRIVKTLRAAGFSAVFAGGAVRDALLNLVPKDLDIATSALPEDIERIFPRTVAVGKAFGTIVVIEDGFNFEVTTFRREGPYLDGRHPEYVEPTDMAEDALRRDFTVNALFYDPVAEEVHDVVGGLEDLRAGRLVTVGSPQKRFAEDHLRRLRAVRFVAQLGFTLRADVVEALNEGASELRRVSVERVLAEMSRLLTAAHVVPAFAIFVTTPMAGVIWPEVAGLDPRRLLPYAPFPAPAVAFAVLARLSGSSPEERLRAWKAPNALLRQAVELVRAADGWPRSTLASRMRHLGSPSAPGLKHVLLSERVDLADELEAFRQVADAEGRLPPPWLNGNDLVGMGFARDAKLGEVLRRLYDEQLEGRVETREDAFRAAEKLKASS